MHTDDQQKEKPRDEGSPITVGGGGGLDDKRKTRMNVRCKFEAGDYPEPMGNPGKKSFRHNGWQIMTFKIRASGETRDLSDLLPENGNCIVSIFCKGHDDDVTINGKHFGIDMDTRTYPEDHDHTNPNAESYIERIFLLAPGKELGHWDFNEDDDCAVCTDHIPNSPNCS